jgi:hypothetical protein
MCGKGVWELPLLDYNCAAYIDVDPASDALITQIKKWLQECKENDPNCSPPPPYKLPYRVLDVGPPDGSQDPILSIGANRPGEYATLSYRWGIGCNLTTTMETIDERTRGIAMALLPGTVRDSVVVARKLGFRYLWVDALCIIQDSAEDWTEHSVLMAEIYRDASLNIAADCAMDAADGFLKPRNPLEVRSCVHHRLFTGASEPHAICPVLPATNDGVTNGALASRGWILQERALSRRIVHWTANEVAWECNGMQATERLPGQNRWTGSTIDFSAGATIKSSALVGHPIKRSDYDGTRLAVQAMFENGTGDSSAVKPGTQPDFAAWCDLAAEYSGRTLTKSEDTLPAIASLAKAFHRSIGNDMIYIAGLWSQDIVRELIWSCRSREDTTLKARDLPSFSWASTREPVEFGYWDVWAVVPETEAVLVTHDLVTAGGPYGPVSRATITLRGYCKKFVDLPLEDQGPDAGPDALRWPKGEVKMDYGVPELVWKMLEDDIVVLCLRTTTYVTTDEETKKEDVSRRMFCMIIGPHGSGGNYYRWGLYTDTTWAGSLDGWEQRTFVIE